MLGINEMYSANHKLNPYGIQGYAIEKTYQEGHNVLKAKNSKPTKEEQKKRQTKRGHYLEDQAKIYGDLSGPGVYNYPASNWGSKSKASGKKIPFKRKLTYIDEIIEKERKQKHPAPGQYKLFKDDKEIRAEKKKLAHQKIHYTERVTYLDGVQFDADQTPGVGSYNTTLDRPKSATMLHKRKQSRSGRPGSSFKGKQKMPSIGSYNPQPIEDHKSFSRKKKGYSEWGRVQRFVGQKNGSNLGPGTYLKGTQDQVVGRKSAKSIYY